MTTSVYFDEIDYSQIDYDPNSTDENMLTDPSASVLALQRLRFLKTRETGDVIVSPDTSGRDENLMLDYNNVSYEEYKMRRKAEVLKYKKNSTLTKRTHYSALASTRRRQIVNVETTTSDCESDIIRVKKATNSGIKGDGSLLFLNKNVTFIENL